MALPYRILRRLPVSSALKAERRREEIDREYGERIYAARVARDDEKVVSLMNDHRFALQLDDEEEDEELTKQLVRQAKRLYVPIPPIRNENGTETDWWYEGSLTFRRKLTPKGVAYLRDEIRKERKAQHELKAVWLPWLAAGTGVLGAATGLAAVFFRGGQ
jgi:hypothetical protein